MPTAWNAPSTRLPLDVRSRRETTSAVLGELGLAALVTVLNADLRDGVDVLPAYHPDLSQNEPGDAPGVVTLMLIPRTDPLQPEAPRPDRFFINAVCDYLDARRLVTTELVLRGPVYKPVWISVGINVVAQIGS